MNNQVTLLQYRLQHTQTTTISRYDNAGILCYLTKIYYYSRIFCSCLHVLLRVGTSCQYNASKKINAHQKISISVFHQVIS